MLLLCVEKKNLLSVSIFYLSARHEPNVFQGVMKKIKILIFIKLFNFWALF